MPFATATLDDCQRANENPLSNGGKWGAITGNQMILSSNLIQSPSGNARSAWTFETFGPDMEVWGRGGPPPLFESLIVGARLHNLGAAFRGYGVHVADFASVSFVRMDLRRSDAGNFNIGLTGTTNLPQTNFSGMGIVVVGTTIEGWVLYGGTGGGGTWTPGWHLVHSVVDATYNMAGYAALEGFQTGAAPTGGFTAFGAGDLEDRLSFDGVFFR